MTNPVRVALVLNRMDSGGIEAVVMNYCRHMPSGQVQFDLYACRDSSFPQKEELEKLNIPVRLIPPYTHVGEYQRVLTRAFREEGYDVVHAHLNTMSVFPLFAAWRAGVPVRICHNHATAHWGEGKKTLLKYILRPFNKWFATHYFACSNQAGKWMFGRRDMEAGRVKILPNAILEETYQYQPREREALRQKLGIAPETWVLGNVGRLTYTKNHDFLLRLTALLKKRGHQVALLLVGEGELEEKIRQEAAALDLENQVIFAGVQKNVAPYYWAMDLFCLPSFYEGFGLAALEARAAGLPCICSEQVSPEVLDETNGCQLKVEGEKALKDWADQAEKYLALPRAPGRPLPPRLSIRPAAAELARWYQEVRKG